MLPPTATLNPAASSIRPVSAVVVDFPFVPVIAMTRPRSHRDASSNSPTMGTPLSRAARTTVCSAGTPGLNTTRSAPVKVSVLCPPSSSCTPRRRSGSAATASSRVSDSVTCAPRRASSSAAAMPLLPAPATVTRFPSTLNPKTATPNRASAKLQRCQAEQRENNRDNHEARNHLGLAPADELEVMMDRRHFEHALSGQFEGGHLDDDRQRFEHEHAADDAEQQFLLDENGHRA